MKDILTAGMYSLIFLVVAFAALYVAWLVLDTLTPGHKIGNRITGEATSVQGVIVNEGSHSAALVAGAWMLMQALIIFTAIWTNAHGTDFWSALGWTFSFSVIGLLLQSVAFFLLDLITPGKLGDEVCAPGPTNPLAKLTAFNIVAVGLIVVAVIS